MRHGKKIRHGVCGLREAGAFVTVHAKPEEPMPERTEPPGPSPSAARRAPVAFGALTFGFGLAAGLLLAFSGYAVLQDSASLVVTVFLAALFVVGLVGSLLVLLRKPLMRHLFGLANAQVELFADPLAKVAESAIERDPQGATDAARDLVRMTLARYAWVSTRRWIVAALTGLIAAMAALAGTALLFQQNELLAVQSQLLADQNTKIEAQSAMLAQEVQLAEAARNAQMAVEITRIAEALGQRLETVSDSAETWMDAYAHMDPLTDLGPELIMRITSASRAIKPYRFLDPPLRAHDAADKQRVAMQPRRHELSLAYGAQARFFGWRDPPEGAQLIDRPASPERAQLLQSLIRAGIRDFEGLNWFGLDLSFAWAEDTDLLGLSLQGAQLSFATFDRAQIRDSDFRGASLENARFRQVLVQGSDFSAIPAQEAKPPYRGEEGVYFTALAGADFSRAILLDSLFSQANAGAISLDGAVLDGVSFAGASLGAATFRDAVLVQVDFTGANLSSVEFDGAVVLGRDVLDGLSQAAAPGSFRADRYEAVPATVAEVMEIQAAFLHFEMEDLARREAAGEIWKLKRVKPFEDQ